jgi:hypothetical protein
VVLTCLVFPILDLDAVVGPIRALGVVYAEGQSLR